MAIMIPDDKIRNVKLTGDEITLLMEELERVPHNMYIFMNYDKIIKKLNDASLEKGGKKWESVFIVKSQCSIVLKAFGLMERIMTFIRSVKKNSPNHKKEFKRWRSMDKYEVEVKKLEIKLEQLKAKRMGKMHLNKMEELKIKLEIAKTYRSKKRVKKIEKEMKKNG